MLPLLEGGPGGGVTAPAGAAGVVLQLRWRRPRSRIPTAGALLGRAMRSRAGRLAVIAGWAWVGLRFFAR